MFNTPGQSNHFLFFYFLYSVISIQTHADTKRIYATKEPFSTGTVFTDGTGWGNVTDFLLVGQSPRFPNLKSGGWFRFDLSEIKDNVIITSVTLNLSVYEDDGTGPIVDFTHINRDPLLIDFPMRWFDIFYGDPYLKNARIFNGTWSLELGDKGNSYLKNQLDEDWFAIGIRYNNQNNYYGYIYGWGSKEAPYIDIDFRIPETILKCKWEKPYDIIEGNIAVLSAEVEGIDPGTLAHWEIWEKDLFGDNKIEKPEIKNIGVYRLGNKYFAKAEWKTEWQPDDHDIAEYYFKVFIGDQKCSTSIRPKYLMNVKRANDLRPPRPDPMQFETIPYPQSSTAISMSAIKAEDEIDTIIEYYFECERAENNCKDSGWMEERTYTNSILIPNTLYGYKIKARDKSVNLNTTQPSKVHYSYTLANRPFPLKIVNSTPYSLSIDIDSNNNPEMTLYAIINDTDGFYIDATGNFSESPTWLSKYKWKSITISNLTPDILYSFKIKAQNKDKIETEWSDIVQGLTKPAKPDLYSEFPIYSIKDSYVTSKTIQLSASITNHPTAGRMMNPWSLQWILSGNMMIGDDDDHVYQTWEMTDKFYPGKSLKYLLNIDTSNYPGINKFNYYGVNIIEHPPKKPIQLSKPKKSQSKKTINLFKNLLHRKQAKNPEK